MRVLKGVYQCVDLLMYLLKPLKESVPAVQGQAAKCWKRETVSGGAPQALTFTLAPNSRRYPQLVSQM